MTVKELEELRLGRWECSMKRKIVIEWRLGLLKYRDIIVTLKISRKLFRQWIRWEYYHRVYKYKNVIDMSKETSILKLQERIKDLERQLEDEKLRSQALNILIDIGEEKYGMELRKKNGTKQLKK